MKLTKEQAEALQKEMGLAELPDEVVVGSGTGRGWLGAEQNCYADAMCKGKVIGPHVIATAVSFLPPSEHKDEKVITHNCGVLQLYGLYPMAFPKATPMRNLLGLQALTEFTAAAIGGGQVTNGLIVGTATLPRGGVTHHGIEALKTLGYHVSPPFRGQHGSDMVIVYKILAEGAKEK